jgi:hypothetical protein
MSDPKLQRADGCSVFFSLILGILLVSAYFLFQMFFDIDKNSDPTQIITDQRKEKVDQYNQNSLSFESKIDNFHFEKNSSIETEMLKTAESYMTDVKKTK